MTRKRAKKTDDNITSALQRLPFPIVDKRHSIVVYLMDDKARSNQGRLEHIASSHHRLTVRDIESIPDGILHKSVLKKDKKRKNTFNYYFEKPGAKGLWIKISIYVDPGAKRVGRIKTIFVTNVVK